MKILKSKNKSVISIIFHIFIFLCSLFILTELFSINFYHKLKVYTNFFTKRKLITSFEKQKIEDICQKADKDLILLYKSDSYSYVKDDIQMKKSTSHLLSYLENKNDMELKSYIFSFYAQIILLIFDVVLIIAWIAICCYFYKGSYLRCLRKIRIARKCLKTIFFFISISLYIIIILMNIIILYHIPIIFQDFSNTFCSLFKISYHTYNGEENFYELRPKWTGVNQIKNLIQKTKQNLRNLIDENNQINNKINEIKGNKYYNTYKSNFIESHINSFCDLNKFNVPNPYPFNDGTISNFLYCSEILSFIEKEYNETFSIMFEEVEDIYFILDSINNNMDKIEFSLDNSKNKIDSFIKIIKDIEIEFFDKLVYIFETTIRKYYLIIIIFFFVLSLLLEIAGFINIIVLRTCYSLKCNKMFNFIWNIRYLFLILIVLIIIYSSSINIFIIDITIILKTSIASEIKERTFSNYNYDMRGINTCINNKGNLSQYMNLYKEAEPISHFYSMINNINENLNYIKNYKINSEKNETKNIFDELEQRPYIAKFKVSGNEDITWPEKILESKLNLYTDNKENQDLQDNEYHSNYYFVFDKDFCKSDYKFLEHNEINEHYLEGKNCMNLKDFPESTEYFKTIKTKNMEIEAGNNYYFNDLINKYKQNYYSNNGFESSFINLLHNSKNYLKNTINVEVNKIKDSLINIYEILKNKINILHNIYKNIIKENSTDLFSAFNCNFFKRDLYIFLDQIESNLSKSIYKFVVFCSIYGACSFLSILSSVFYIKINIEEKILSEKFFKPKKKLEENNINEKPKIRTINEKLNYDEVMKSNEQTELKSKRRPRIKHIIDTEFDKK